MNDPLDKIELPEMTVRRGGIEFKMPTIAERRAQSAMKSMVERIAQRIMTAQHEAIEDACRTALVNGWDIHLYDPPPLVTSSLTRITDRRAQYLGIGFTPAEHAVPTIHRHAYNDDWEY
jgi:hypothetical protein